MYEYPVTIKKIIDADTIDVEIDLGYKIHHDHRLRLARINAPELRTAEGVAAKEFVQQFTGMKGRIVSIKDRSDAYGHYLAEVYVPMNIDGVTTEVNLNDYLLENGMAALYKS